MFSLRLNLNNNIRRLPLNRLKCSKVEEKPAETEAPSEQKKILQNMLATDEVVRPKIDRSRYR